MIPARQSPGRAVRASADWAPRIFEVAELASHISWVLGGAPSLHDVWLRGEVSSLTQSSNGHFYFTLKDATCQLKSVLFRGNAIRSPALPRSGEAIVAHGDVRFYERQGSCEFLADLVFPEGVGLAQMQHEALFRRLEAEGIFSTARKRRLPPFPRRIGIISSDGGAVIHDLLTVLGRRYPLAEVVFIPSLVQGDTAPRALIAALRQLGAWRSSAGGPGVELIILARGGGSTDDLACFNDEALVRAIFASPVPVVSAVGHETDVTLADMAADLRAPTPSAAAEMVTPDLPRLRQEVGSMRIRAQGCSRSSVRNARAVIRSQQVSMATTLAHRLRVAREQVVGRRLQLGALSPTATLGRGYAVAEMDGRAVLDAAAVPAGADLAVRLRSGRLAATVVASQPDEVSRSRDAERTPGPDGLA